MDSPFQLSKNWSWFLIYGVAMIILGTIAISLSTMTVIVTIMLLGTLMIIGGIITLVDSFKFWRSRLSGFVVHLIMGILYLIVGIWLVSKPLTAAVTLTLLLGIMYIVLGTFRMLGAMMMRLPYWGWRLASGILTAILGIIILCYWPAVSLFVIGLIVGIDLLFTGWTYILLAIAAKTNNLPA